MKRMVLLSAKILFSLRDWFRIPGASSRDSFSAFRIPHSAFGFRLRRAGLWGALLGLWGALAAGAAPAAPADSLELAWCTVEASSCCMTTGSLRLYGVAGQPDAGTLSAVPLVLAGGFVLPGDPVIKLLAPAQPVTWGIGEWVNLPLWADLPVAGDRIRLELWRNRKKVANLTVSQSSTWPAASSIQVPGVAEGGGYSLRAVSERLESLGNPNPWVETAPIISVVRRNGVARPDWALYD